MINSFLDKYIFTGGFKYSHNNFFLMGIPFLMVPTGLLVSLAQKGDKNFDKEIYYSFKHSMASALKKEFGVNFEAEGEKGLLLLEEMFTAFGWGQLKHVDLEKENKRAIVVVTSSAIGSRLAGQAKLPADHFLRGIIAGIFFDYFESDVECVESKCAATGENNCEFVVKKKGEFDFSKETVQSQLDTDR
ncbi:MAG: V4R domain-containing protein [archaeon]